MSTYGAVTICRNDGYGGDTERKTIYCLSALINLLDEVYYIDWNSPEDKPLIDVIRDQLPHKGKLHTIVITQEQASELTKHDPDAQKCCEVLARNIGLRRLTTDYRISTNYDVMCISRESIEQNTPDPNTFYVVARTEINFSDILESKCAPGSPELFEYMARSGKGGQHMSGSPLGPQDRWSLVTSCGDFQIAHRNVWYGIKGFDENLLYRGYADSNVQRKADFYGFGLQLVRDIKAYHSQHYPDTGASGGAVGRWNDGPVGPVIDYTGTKNTDNWGFADMNFKEEVI